MMPPPPPKPLPPLTPQLVNSLPYVCEWNGCGRQFRAATSVLYHVTNTHVTEDSNIEYCKWPKCDSTPRARWSMITHVQDHHCTEQSLRVAAVRRYELSLHGQTQVNELAPPPPHPGYARHAALEAIRRHSYNFIARDMTEENEGPVTKSLRFTSCLILRNLARYSAEGRRLIKRQERHLSWLALSRLEGRTALAQCLAELASTPEDDEEQQ